jgi:hypothetical protein
LLEALCLTLGIEIRLNFALTVAHQTTFTDPLNARATNVANAPSPGDGGPRAAQRIPRVGGGHLMRWRGHNSNGARKIRGPARASSVECRARLVHHAARRAPMMNQELRARECRGNR